MIRRPQSDQRRAAVARRGEPIGFYPHLLRAAERRPSGSAVVDRSGTLTYAGLLAEVERAAAALNAAGVRTGDVVSWQLPNWREAAVVHLAALRLGAVSNPIVPIYREREIADVLRRARSAVLVVPDEFRGVDFTAVARRAATAAGSAVTLVAVGETRTADVSWAEFLGEAATSPPTARQDPDDLALLQFTSGTTANAKGVLHSNATLGRLATAFTAVWETTEDDAVLTVSPLSHMAGLLTGLFVPVLEAIPSVYLDRWNADEAIELIQRHRCTLTAGAATFLSGLLASPARTRADMSSLRFMTVGGSDVSPHLVRQAHEAGIAAGRSYGSTECPVVSAGRLSDDLATRSETDGGLLPGVTVSTHREDGRHTASGEAGELVVGAPQRMIGYLDEHDEADTLLPDGRFRTGDLGVVDEHGRVTITGRLKDLIIRGGENISAKEIEDVLHEDRSVGEAAVVGVPDPVLGERVVAYVTPAAGVARSQLDPDAIIASVSRAGLARQKIPESVIVLDELPHTASGKVQKYVLRARPRA